MEITPEIRKLLQDQAEFLRNKMVTKWDTTQWSKWSTEFIDSLIEPKVIVTKYELDGKVWRRGFEGLLWNNGKWNGDKAFEHAKIFEVKRVADGMTFAVGDVIVRSESYRVKNSIKAILKQTDVTTTPVGYYYVADFVKPSSKTEEHGFNRFENIIYLHK